MSITTGTWFWLKEYIVKGFVLDDARLKNPGKGRDCFDELTRRLQDIRTSERRLYQKITDIYATSVDYDASHPLTQVRSTQYLRIVRCKFTKPKE